MTTELLLSRHKTQPPFLLRLNTHKAVAWDTMVGLSTGLGALRWALNRR